MATMKRDDMIKEKIELKMAIADHAIRFFAPLTNMVSGVARLMFLDDEIRKVTPKPSIVKEEPLEIKPEEVTSA